MVVFLKWCGGGIFVVVFLWSCGGVVFLWGVLVVVFLWCFCGGILVVVFLWCFCGGVVMLLSWCFCGGAVVFLFFCPGSTFVALRRSFAKSVDNTGGKNVWYKSSPYTAHIHTHKTFPSFNCLHCFRDIRRLVLQVMFHFRSISGHALFSATASATCGCCEYEISTLPACSMG